MNVDLEVQVSTVSDRRAAVLIGLVAFTLFVFVDPYHRAVPPTQSDEPHYLLIRQSLELDGDLDLARTRTAHARLQQRVPTPVSRGPWPDRLAHPP
jgi:hypothetical protein